MINERGSVLIMVIVTISIVLLLGMSLLMLTQSSAAMTDYNYKSTSSYYIAESGIERSVSIIKYDIEKMIQDIRDSALIRYNKGEMAVINSTSELKNYIDSRIKNAIWAYVVGNGENSFYSAISQYEGQSGIDSNLGIVSGDTKCYYKITCTIPQLNNEDSVTSIRIKLESTGYSGNGSRKITSEYRVSYNTTVYETIDSGAAVVGEFDFKCISWNE